MMVYILEAAVKETNKETVWLRIQIHFAPSQGMLINCLSISQCKIGLVTTDGLQIIGQIDKVLEPTDEKHLLSMFESGWVLKEKFRPHVPATRWIR